MSSARVIYTIGHLPSLTLSDFMIYLKKYGINCVVDIRELLDNSAMGKFSRDNLNLMLKDNGIFYMSFVEELGRMNASVRNSRGIPVYDKVIVTEHFKRGIERLENGMQKGFTIVILGMYSSPANCTRFTITGRYLNELGYSVYHIFSDGNAVGQTVMEEKLQLLSDNRRRRQKQAWNLGRKGEGIAADYLMRNGYTILDRNWNLHKGCELDIIAFKDNTLHAIEVKTRSNDDYAPEMAVNDKKLKNIIKALQQYRYEKHLFNVNAQIDCIAIVLKGENDFSLKVIENLVRRTTWRY